MTDLTEQLNAWHNKSGIGHCATCDGIGYVASHQPATMDDPYPEVECPDCFGMDQVCEVCSSTVYINGFDCLVCDMVLELQPSQLDADTALELAGAIYNAVGVVARHHDAVRELAA